MNVRVTETEAFMRLGAARAGCAALVLAGALAGCATTVDMGGPLGHYRYNYDSRLVTYRTPPAVVYEPATTYREPVVTYQEPVVTYRQPVASYREPVVVYDYRAATVYHDHGQ
jgi:hypothetical protein